MKYPHLTPLFFVCAIILTWPAWCNPADKEPQANSSLSEPDHRYIGAQIIGKFESFELMVEYLSLSKAIGNYPEFPRKSWNLHDVVMDMDFLALGHVASWRVSGPEKVINDYVDGLRAVYEDGSVFYDFGADYFELQGEEDQ